MIPCLGRSFSISLIPLILTVFNQRFPNLTDSAYFGSLLHHRHHLHASHHTNNILQCSEKKQSSRAGPALPGNSGEQLLSPGCACLGQHPEGGIRLCLPFVTWPLLPSCHWDPPGEGSPILKDACRPKQELDGSHLEMAHLSAAPQQGLGLTLGLLVQHSSFHSLHRPFQQLAGTNLAGLLKRRHGHFSLGAGGRAAGDAGELLGKESLRSRRSAAHGEGLTLTNPAPARLLALLLPAHPTEVQH